MAAMRKSLAPAMAIHHLIFAAMVLLSGCATFSSGEEESLRTEIETVLSTPPLDQVNWGIEIVDPAREQSLFRRNAHRKFVPASNMKILSTATALSLLGTDFRYRTDLLGVGVLEKGDSLFRGDLLLSATGDPTLSQRFFPSAEAPLDSLAQGLWEKGIRSVTGALVVDVSAWDSTTVPGSWMVQNLSGTSGATGGAFSIAEGVLNVEITAGKQEGEGIRARWWPFLPDDALSVQFLTVHPDSSARGREYEYLPESRHLRIHGPIPAGEVDTIRIAQRDPVRLASNALLHALQRRGITVEGGLRIAWETGEAVGPGDCVTGGPEVPNEICVDAVRLTGLTSPPMAEIVKAILEPSQNWMTEQLVKTLGSVRGEKGSWREGFRVEQEFLTQEVGLDSLDIFYQDGSGLSAYNLVTPRAIVRILDYMRESPNGEVFRDALASPGEDPSTLRNRLNSLEGRLFAKTGTINHVNSLSGYLITDSGRELIFSILTNGSGLSSRLVRAGIDEIVQVVARR